MATKTVEARLTELTARLEQQEAELQALKSGRRARRSAAAPQIEALSARGEKPVEPPRPTAASTSSRRQLLMLAGGAVAAAAGATALGARQADAANGDTMTVAGTMTGTGPTSLNNTAGDAFHITGGGTHGNGVQSAGAGSGSGVQGDGGSGGGPGLIGNGGGSSGEGVHGFGGSPNGNGVIGLGAGSGVGVTASGGANGGDGIRATGGAPVSPSNAAGTGVVGIGVASGGSGADGIGVKGLGGPLAPGVSGSGSYGGQFDGSLAPVLLMGHGSPGAPTANFHLAGEIYVDSDGTFWVCGSSGTPGKWFSVATLTHFFGAQPNTGGVMNLLPTPIRILDTRSGSPYGGGTTHALQVTGTVDLNGSGFAVPANAVAVVGNVTAVFPQGDGDLRLFPHGTGLPTTSNLNYKLNVTIANSAIVSLDKSGQMDIYVDVNTTHVLFDASGFVM